MRLNSERSLARTLGKLVVVWALAAVMTAVIRRAISPAGRRVLARREERARRELRFWRDWLTSLRDELRGRQVDPVVTRDARSTVTTPLEQVS